MLVYFLSLCWLQSYLHCLLTLTFISHLSLTSTHAESAMMLPF